MLIYFDSVTVIYLLDHTGPSQQRAVARLTTLLAAGDRIAVSDLTRLKCRVKPMKSRGWQTVRHRHRAARQTPIAIGG